MKLWFKIIVFESPLVAQMVESLPTMQETWIQSLGWGDLEKGIATHFSILAGQSHGWRSLAGPNPWRCKESDTTKQLTHTRVPKANLIFGFPSSSSSKASTCSAEDPGSDPWIGKIFWRKKWQPTPVFLPREFHGQRSLVGSRGCKELDTTEGLIHTHSSFEHFFSRWEPMWYFLHFFVPFLCLASKVNSLSTYIKQRSNKVTGCLPYWEQQNNTRVFFF